MIKGIQPHEFNRYFRISFFKLSIFTECVLAIDTFDLSTNQITIDIGGIPEGVYLMSLSNDEVVHKLKIIRMK